MCVVQFAICTTPYVHFAAMFVEKVRYKTTWVAADSIKPINVVVVRSKDIRSNLVYFMHHAWQYRSSQSVTMTVGQLH